MDVLPLNARLIGRCRTLMEKYRDLPMDLTDGTLVALAEQEKIEQIFTLNHKDFNIYRPDHVGHFQISPGLP